MKDHFWRLPSRFCLTILLFLIGCIHCQNAVAAPLVATVLSVRGASQVSHAGKVAKLSTNGSLYIGDMVRIGAGAKATLLFKDGSQVRLNSNSTIQITAPAAIAGGKRSLFRVIGGEIWARLRPNRGVQTASAILGVAGTEFDVRVTDNETVLTVIEGVVNFSNSFGAVSVAASQQSTATPTSAPTQPISVQGAGFIVEWTLDLENATIPREKFFVSLDHRSLQTELTRRTANYTRDTKNDVARRELVEVLFDLKQYEKALAVAEGAGESRIVAPNEEALLLIRTGYTLLELARPEEAEKAFRNALDLANIPAAQEEAWTGLSTTQLAESKFAEAQQSAREALKAVPESVEANIALGLALSRKPGREAEARLAFESALTAQPETLRYQAQSWLAYLDIAQNNNVAALQNGLGAIKAAPESGLAHGNLALVYFFDNQSSKAVQEAKIASRLNSKSVAAKIVLGQALLANGDVDGAARAAAEAVALDPQFTAGHYLLGIADAQRRDYVHAERSLRESLRLTPQFLPAASALARVYNRMGRQKGALSLLTTLQTEQTQNGGVAAALGEVLYEQANYSESVTQFEKAVALQPASAFNYASLARVAIDANLLNQAVVAGQKAVSLAPNIGQYHAILGLAYTYSRLDVQAEREYRSALSLDPQNALALVQLALLNQDGDVRTTKRNAGLAFAQGFLYDPAISKELLRGGVENELKGSGGSDGSTVTYTLRDIGDDGNFHFYGRANRGTDDGNRANSYAREVNGRQDTTYTVGNNTNIYLHTFRRENDSGLPGTITNPVTDDRDKFGLNQGILATKTRIGSKGQLFTGFFANSQEDARLNPNRDNSSVLSTVTLFPVSVTESAVHSSASDPELRFDWNLSSDPTRPSILSLGAARLSTRKDSTIDLFTPGIFGGPDSTGILNFNNRARTNLFFAQLTKRSSEKLNFSLQLRAQRTKTSRNFVFRNLSGNALQLIQFSNPTPPSKTDFLPAASVHFQLDKRTALRAFLSRRTVDFTSSILTPAETQLSSEGQIVPLGLPDRTSIAEFDFERRMPGNGFLKLFGFHSTSKNLLFDASNFFDPTSVNGNTFNNAIMLGRVKRYGMGARYEKQLSGNLFGQAGLVLNRTRSDLTGFTPYQPAYLAISGLNYVDQRGNKASVTLNYAGSFTASDATGAASARFPAKATIDLLLSREPTVRQEIFLQVINLFDARQIAYRGVPTGARRVQIGMSKRF